ncbi:RloB family protein [Candidatus Methanarcanum hacksteinii]|uniref:RloB family protein n=1 Tax=Candidatus Methanarcanum hacksteinii TaxID=2911857 RepID=UPI0037DCBB4D
MTRRGGYLPDGRRKAMEILAVEGSSEKVYFDRLARLGVTDMAVRTVDCHGGDIKKVRRVCECMLDDRNRKQGDSLGVVIDVDNTSKDEMLRFLDWCEGRDIEVYISNPSFEVFLLMHFIDVPSSISQHDMEGSLGRLQGRRYEKACGISISEESVKAALTRADKALPSRSDTVTCLEHPGTTTVHRLVRKIASRYV